MIRASKSPLKKIPVGKVKPRDPGVLGKSNGHKHTSSTPVPYRSPSPGKERKNGINTSSSKVQLRKVDLRKGAFSVKQSLASIGVERSAAPTARETPVPPKNNKYQVLSKQFKINKSSMLKDQALARDSQGFYIPDLPPMIHEDIINIRNN